MKALVLAAIVFGTAGIMTAQAPRYISRDDQAQIRAAVRAVTKEPILHVHAVTLSRPAPGAVAYKGIEGALENGKVVMKPRIFYERTDEVTVATGSRANLKGPSYFVRRVGRTWKVVGKSFWIR